MRKYSFEIKSTDGETITKYIIASTKKEAVERLENRTYLINGKMYEIVKNSLKWTD